MKQEMEKTSQDIKLKVLKIKDSQKKENQGKTTPLITASKNQCHPKFNLKIKTMAIYKIKWTRSNLQKQKRKK